MSKKIRLFCVTYATITLIIALTSPFAVIGCRSNPSDSNKIDQKTTNQQDLKFVPVDFCGKSYDIETIEIACYDSKVNDIRNLASLINIRDISISGTQVSDVSALATLTKLTKLNLSLTQVSDVSALATLTNLTFIDLRDTKVSDVSALATLTNLTSIYLRGSQVSEEQVKALQSKLPKCEISY